MSNGFITKNAARKKHGISRRRLDLAVQIGEVAVIYFGVGGRVKVRESDVLRILAGACTEPADPIQAVTSSRTLVV